ncbi:unnamed protein product [Protopolystoma xenopodis]|uniref:Uncharacterized protein n=1 Tax=Protopolystoma xenopodis TaxID=117903 RepID=A0A448XBZ6_9PLAT|nr:unnamed protein product [Protopolystoma xenopodis]
MAASFSVIAISAILAGRLMLKVKSCPSFTGPQVFNTPLSISHFSASNNRPYPPAINTSNHNEGLCTSLVQGGSNVDAAIFIRSNLTWPPPEGMPMIFYIEIMRISMV